MHWTICAINPEPSSETKETRFEKDLNGLRQRNIHYCNDIFWNLLLILFAPKKFPEPNNNANIIFFYLVYLHRHNHSYLSHINLYRLLMDLFKGKMILSHRGACGKGHSAGERLSQWAELSDSSLIHELMTHSCFIWFRGKIPTENLISIIYIW